ncbi:histidine phosphatase family protein [Sporosarcina limicola]|uniref:2,3-bisphosphoglycerate-dependent phosphoglycerate mutase n=1 Tax=Sporosarcina limicola TaxID=34101 RepID=A0A927MEC4_9BACL|nr:2,3-bisphosphoglycerate-dependent phosphoglycerate mutase [Sporosarcina limicola]
MEKIVYVVRHCEAEGQAPDADLTSKGVSQAKQLGRFFADIHIDRIISSPYVRAQQSIGALSEAKRISVETDNRFAERMLSKRSMDDWMSKLEDTFLDFHLKYEGGESSNEATARVRDVVDELSDGLRIVLVTHGNLMALLLKSFDDRVGFVEWKSLTNPDVYWVRISDNGASVERIWGVNVILSE